MPRQEIESATYLGIYLESILLGRGIRAKEKMPRRCWDNFAHDDQA